MSLDIIILAAGNGKRMGKQTPKVLCKIGNLPIIDHIFNTVSHITYNNIFLVLDEGVQINNLIKGCKIIHQRDKLGTAYATKLVLNHIEEDLTLILYGDTPFITPQVLNAMLEQIKNKNAEVALFAFKLKNTNDPYGRLVINNEGFVEKIMEYQDIKNLNYNFNLANSGTMAIKTYTLKKHLLEINNSNIQNEYYLTDIVQIIHKNGGKVCYIEGLYDDAIGINTQEDLANAEHCFQERMRDYFVKLGVTLLDSKTVYFSYDTKILGEGAVIHQNVVFEEGVTLEGKVEIFPFSYLKNCTIKHGSKIGPFAHIRENSTINENSEVGNFVEIKASNVHQNVKVKHLSYIGNTTVEEKTNIGAGTITCNYDGKSKHATYIGKNCFVGANTVFVAPLIMADNSRTAAGSTITKDIEKDSLAIARAVQVNKPKKKSVQVNKSNKK